MCGHPCRGWSRSSHLYVGSEYQLILLDLDHWVFCFSSPRQGLAVLCSPAPGPWVHYLPDFRFNLTVLLFGLVLVWFWWFCLVWGFESTCLCMWRPEVDPGVLLTVHLMFFETRSLTEARAHWLQLEWFAASSCLCFHSTWITGMQSVLVFMLTWKALGQ